MQSSSDLSPLEGDTPRFRVVKPAKVKEADPYVFRLTEADWAVLREKGKDDHFYGAWVGGKASEGGGPLEGEPFGDASKKAAWLKANESRYANDPEFAAACDALTGYTTGGYDVIRDISAGGDGYGAYAHLVNPDGSYKNDFKADTFTHGKLGNDSFDRGDGKGFTGRAFKAQIDPSDPTRTVESKFTTQEGAMALNRMVDRAPRSETPVYRGLGEYFGSLGGGRIGDVPPRPIPKVGDTMDIRGVTSFTRSEKTASTFAKRTNVGTKGGQPDREWMFEVHGARAVNIDALSPWNQQEAITRGKFRVKDVKVEKTLLRYEYDIGGGERRRSYGTPDEHGFVKDYYSGKSYKAIPVYAKSGYRKHYGGGRSSEDYPAERVRVILEGVD